MQFGDKFRQERKKQGLTQKEAAQGLGINVRMITRYENNLAFPRTKEAYKKIADFFDVDVNYLLTEDEEFAVEASEKYGSRGMKQARALLDDMSGLFAGGTLSDEDRDTVMKAMQDIYWEAKQRNADKYTPKKYRKNDTDAENQ